MKSSGQRVAAVLIAIATGAGLVACSSDDATASTCKALQDLSASLRAFGDVNVVEQGANGVESAVDDVRTAARQAKADASDQFAGDIDDLESAIGTLRSAISDGRGDQSVSEWLSAIADDVGAVSDAGQKLRDDAAAELGDCDLSG